MGPVEVLLPSIVKDDMHGSAFDLGLVFAAGGLASMACAVAPRRPAACRAAASPSCMLAWTVATLAVAAYGVAGTVWQLMLVSAVFNGLETAGTIVWATTKQRHVPGALLGRVSSLDWLISVGLLPLSFALTGPGSSAAIGARATLDRRRRPGRDRDATRRSTSRVSGPSRGGRPRSTTASPPAPRPDPRAPLTRRAAPSAPVPAAASSPAPPSRPRIAAT